MIWTDAGTLEPWVWLAGGVLLCAGEMLAAGMFLLWIGLAAMATGATVFVFAVSLEWTLILFGVYAVVFVALGRRVYGSQDRPGDRPFLNRRAEALLGREFTLDHAIEGGEGRIRVNDSVWRVRGPDLPAGAKVTVTGVEDGVLLRVAATGSPPR
jgi:membrane protein implicated in regulation of membrane protease activity